MKKHYPLYFICAGLISLALTLLCGLIGGLQYVTPDFVKNSLPFYAVRPLHTLFAVGWIVLTATGGIYYYLDVKGQHQKRTAAHFWIFLLTGIGIVFSYLSKNFEGKEYLEFPSFFYFPVVLGWILFGVSYFKIQVSSFGRWPVYYWMWATGIVLMIYHFTEAHLWLLPYFKEHFVQNVAIQWKAGGSFVGSWNMLVYGTSMYVMAKIAQDERYALSRKAFFFYFLGLANLMFGWAHHIYIVPVSPWIRYSAYIISMTEWILLVSIIYDWKKGLKQERKIAFSLAYKLMLLADFWVFMNIILALLISIPAINLFTHGTHVTVAHSMGTTIGINTMILLSSVTFILEQRNVLSLKDVSKILKSLKVFNVSFVLFFMSLMLMGVKKSHWIFFDNTPTFSQLQDKLHWLHIMFVVFGVGIVIGLYRIIFLLLRAVKNVINLEAP